MSPDSVAGEDVLKAPNSDITEAGKWITRLLAFVVQRAPPAVPGVIAYSRIKRKKLLLI